MKPLQVFVAQNYADGEFNHVTHVEEAGEVGDTLFLFAMNEAGDADTLQELYEMLETAQVQLWHLQQKVEQEQIDQAAGIAP